MGVLFNSPRTSQCHMSDDGFCIVDDRSCTSFGTKHRSTRYSRTASSLYHSFLVVICRVGHVHNANHHRSLPTTGDNKKTDEGSGKAEHTTDGPLALSTTAAVPGQSICCSAGTQESDNVLTSLIHKSRSDAKIQPLGSLIAGDSANADSKPRIKSASLGDKQNGAQEEPPEESISHVAESRREELTLSFSSFDDEFNAADVPLPPSPAPMLLVDRSKGGNYGQAPTAGRFEKRRRDDSDDEITPNPVCFKRVMRRTLEITVSMRQDDAKVMLLEVVAKASNRPSTFEVAQWSDIDWQSMTVASSNYPRNPHTDAEISLADSNADSAELPPTPFPLISAIEPSSNELDTNTNRYVSAIQKFDEIIGNCDALARFKKDQGKCLANNQRGTRCGSWEGIRIEVRPIVGKLLAELRVLNFESRPSFCVHKLLTFTNLAVCHWQRKGIREKVYNLLQQRQLEQSYGNGLCKYLPLFLPYRPPESAHLTVNEFVVQQAMEPFDINPDRRNELGEGYLYVYWNEATFGIRKIGYTTGKVKDRLDAWEKDCNHIATQQYSSPAKVRHAARVEQLVHADLMDYRVFEPACRGCLKSHVEWFKDVDLSFIIRRIEAWTDWIGEGPYEKVGRKWHLTDKGKERMPIVTRPDSSREPAEHAKPSANTPWRYNLRSMIGRKPRRTSKNTSELWTLPDGHLLLEDEDGTAISYQTGLRTTVFI